MDVQRLLHEVHGAGFIALEGVVEFAPGGADENDGNLLGALGTAHQFGELKTVHAGHLHVEDGQRELMAQQQFQRLFGRLRAMDPDVRRLQQGFQGQ